MKIEILLKILLKVLLYGGVFVLIVSGFVFYTSVHPPRMVSAWNPADFGLKHEDVTLRTEDGVELSAWFVPSGASDNAVILCHGYPADKGNILGLAPILSPYFNLLFFDFRAMGKSGGNATTVGFREVKDLKAAVEYLKKRGMKKIGVYGFSMGGAVAIMAADPAVSAVLSESSFAKLVLILDQVYEKMAIFKYPFVLMTKIYAMVFLGIDVKKISPAESIKKLEIPILLIHSEEDSQIPLAHAFILKEANPKVDLWVVPKADHGESLDRGEYRRRVVDFFRKNL